MFLTAVRHKVSSLDKKIYGLVKKSVMPLFIFWITFLLELALPGLFCYPFFGIKLYRKTVDIPKVTIGAPLVADFFFFFFFFFFCYETDFMENRREGNDQESIQLSHTSHQRHQRERNTNTK